MKQLRLLKLLMRRIVIFTAAGITLLAVFLFYLDFRMGQKERRILIDEPSAEAPVVVDDLLTPMPE